MVGWRDGEGEFGLLGSRLGGGGFSGVWIVVLMLFKTVNKRTTIEFIVCVVS